MSAAAMHIALVGNPNCGKTALFNRLTGSRQKVANYPGVTVERKEGHFHSATGRHYRVLDLPGAYSLDAVSLEEVITRDVCRGVHPDERAPEIMVCVVDATNLRLHLRFVLELRALGRPMIVALNMMDAAARRGIRIDTAALSAELGLPVLETIAVRRGGSDALVQALDTFSWQADAANTVTLSKPEMHAEVRRLIAGAVHLPAHDPVLDERLDRILLHPTWGLAVLAGLMFVMFQAVYVWAAPMMDAIDASISSLGIWAHGVLPDGPLRSLLVDGVIAGIGAVLVFLPQILILFTFILLLEESGYLPRAAFLLDHTMASAGLSGRSFIPLLSSFACAVPGIMAARSIADPRDRLATILVAPLMTCSARLPVYALLIGAFIPRQQVLGVLNLQGLVLFSLYVFGIVSALAVAYVMKKWRRDGGEHPLLLELPSYRLPHPRDLLLGLWERALIFLRRVGGVILAMTILLWFLLSYPGMPDGAAGAAIDYSFAGRIGHAMTLLFAPIGFDWRICIALIPTMAAREVMVSSLATVYAVAADDQAAQALSPLLAQDWSLATALALLVWFVYAPQCVSTLATIRRETNSWKQVGIAAGYLFALAYLAAFVTYRVALWLGAG